MNLGNQIHDLRKKHNLSQEQLAEKNGVARQTISKWELGETAPDIKQALQLSQIFNVDINEMVGSVTKNSVNIANDCKKKNTLPWKKIIAGCVALLLICIIVVCVFDVVDRSKILHPEGVEGKIVIVRKDPIAIGKGVAGTIVFDEQNKPTILCELPEGFVAEKEKSGLYTDEDGNFIMFNADYSDKIINPLLGTDYHSYYIDRGYNTYMEMANAAMYYDYPELGIFSSIEEVYLSGGAQLLREQLCAGQNADYYAIDGGLIESGNKSRLYGFALHFDNSTWLIILKDYDDRYYYITIKDPNGIGKTIDTIGEFLSDISLTE